jgi:hypothetical protein
VIIACKKTEEERKRGRGEGRKEKGRGCTRKIYHRQCRALIAERSREYYARTKGENKIILKKNFKKWAYRKH